jgi:hypothetical protein
VDLGREAVDLRGQVGVLLDEELDLLGAVELLVRQLFAMLGVGFGVDLVPLGLAALGQQDQRRRIAAWSENARLRRMYG